MKRILYTCLAAFAAAYTAPAADEPEAAGSAAEETPAAVAEEPAAEAQEAPTTEAAIAGVRSKMEAATRAYADLSKPTRMVTTNYNRLENDVKEALQKLEDSKKQMEEIEGKLGGLGGTEFEFSAVPEDERYKYETEGTAMVKKVIDALSSKAENTQLEGLRLYDALRESYQGIPRFKEAHSLYEKAVNKLEKKWSTQLENIKRERQKRSASQRDQLSEGERRQYDQLARKMESENLNIEEDWFIPKMNNATMLDKALSRARRAKSSLQSRITDSEVDVPALLHRFWDNMDAARELMLGAKLAEASAKLSEDNTLRELGSLSRTMLPDSVRDGLRKQHQLLSEEIRNRQNEQRRLELSQRSARMAFERQLRTIDLRIDRMMETLTLSKEDEVRRAEEAAAREAELRAQEEREAAENAADEDGESADEDQGGAAAADDGDAKPKKSKKKGSKKKKAE